MQPLYTIKIIHSDQLGELTFDLCYTFQDRQFPRFLFLSILSLSLSLSLTHTRASLPSFKPSKRYQWMQQNEPVLGRTFSGVNADDIQQWFSDFLRDLL
jgi:hypothetical protein